MIMISGLYYNVERVAQLDDVYYVKFTICNKLSLYEKGLYVDNIISFFWGYERISIFNFEINKLY